MAGRVDLEAGTRRKRRPKSVCPNPLFVKWVEELRDEAREKGIKSQYSYTKALNSIKKYPLPLTSGQEAKILDHVGEKLAKMLDKRLAEHLANGGTLDDQTASSSPKKVRKRSKDPPPSNLSRDLTTPSSESGGPSGISCDSQGSSSTKHTPTSMGKKPKKKRSPREYIPVYRSGPYAILVALYNAEQKLNYCGYLNKSQLISQAQPYCDPSFTVPDEGSYYTAWRSMSNLVKKGFVSKSSHPPRFSLTDAGVTLAIRMLKSSTTAQAQGSQQSQDQLCDRSPSEKSQLISNEQGSPILLVNSPLSSPCSEGTDSYSLDEIEEKAEQHTSDDDMESPFVAHSRLCFWYVNMDGKCVHSKDDAAVTFNETVSVGFLVKCRKSLLESVSLRYTLDLSRKQDGPYIYAYLCNDNAPDFSDPPESEEKETRAMDTNEVTLSHQGATTCVLPKPHGTSIVLSDSDSDMEVAPLADRIGLTRGNINDRGRKRDKDSVAEKEFDTGSSRNRDAVSNSRYSQSESCDFAKRRKANDGSSMPHALTPSQAAGLAALKRINQSSQQSPPPPVLDLTSDGSDEDEIQLLKTQSYMHNSARVATTTDKSSHNTLYDLETETSVGEAATCATSTVEKRLGDDSSGKKHSERCQELKVTGSDAMCSVRYLESSAKPVMRDEQTLSLSNPCLGRNSNVSGSSSSGIGGSLTHGALEDQSISGGPEESQSIDLSSPEFVLSPGQFEVILCIDNSESTASRKSSSQFRGLLLQDLGKNGVKFDVRKLNVGDFVWVAKEKAVPLPGQLGLPPSREILLEHVVERKRMDDLAGSITDGRFHEQKFRLKQCGVRHPVYLVEEFGDISHLKLSARSLEQAITNTQIIDGFFVKRTKDIRDSVAYLTIMTRTLQQHYSNKTIKAYPWDTIVKLNKGEASRDPDVVCSIAFSTFNEVSVKSKVLSVYEMFGRHLINLPNCSAEKAAAVLEKYPTISHLREAYQKCGTESEREALLSGLRAGRTKRKLGPILSHLIYSLYWKGT